ncbi:MAG: hypothetical protein HQ521_19545, partial [Bacteroidetes bacterium]|nr:hypothetical protein [Bacteroidota bacterium]
MNKDEFIGFLQKPENLNAQSVTDLVGLIAEFPYCQTARILLTLNLFKEKNIRYDSELKTTAVYVSNRGLLKKHIDRLNSEDVKVVLPDEEIEVVPQKETPPKEVEEEITKKEPSVVVSEENAEQEAASIAEVKNIIERHISELEAENEIRKNARTKKVEPSKPAKLKNELIDDFIKNEPSISRPKVEFYNPVIKARESIVDHENIVSETLANIFYDQGHLQKAIKIYQKLSLKFPEKSSYF